MTYSELRLCSNRAAFEAIPNPRRPVDLSAVRARIDSEGVPVIDARVMLIAGDAQEVTISRDGRILIKLKDADAARRMFVRALAWVEGSTGLARA